MNKIQRGFTLVELIIVITVLGILAAFLIPRYIGVSSEARVAVVQGVAGSLRSAIAITHGQYLITGQTPVILDGATINLKNGYPVVDVTSSGVLGTLNGTITLDSGSTGTIGSLKFSLGTNIITLYPASATDKATCGVIYTNNGSDKIGDVSSITSGC